VRVHFRPRPNCYRGRYGSPVEMLLKRMRERKRIPFSTTYVVLGKAASTRLCNRGLRVMGEWGWSSRARSVYCGRRQESAGFVALNVRIESCRLSSFASWNHCLSSFFLRCLLCSALLFFSGASTTSRLSVCLSDDPLQSFSPVIRFCVRLFRLIFKQTASAVATWFQVISSLSCL
jgi:hypothetical protein